MLNTIQESMEDVSIAYVEALCAANGYTLNRVSRDNDGVDATIRCKGYPSEGCKLFSPSLDIQLKSSFSRFKQKKDGNYKFILEAKNYTNLVQGDRMTPIILVILHMDRDRQNWVKHSINCLQIRKCAYWVNLKNNTPTRNGSNITINVPRANILSCSALKKLIIKVSKEEEL